MPTKLKDIAKAVGAKNESEILIDNICTDTRKIVPGCLFIAIKGENFDGHDFIEKAYELGAVAAVSHKQIPNLKNILFVENTHRALLKLAEYYKKQFSLFTVGITGSVGKTSTKEMIYSVLSENGKAIKTEGNFNNEIGMPMSMFNINREYDYGVFEMGMDKFGQISDLSMVAKPDVGVITNIGVSHIESLGSRENILKAKLEILDYMPENAPLVVNGDDDLLVNVESTEKHTTVTYGIENVACDIKAEDVLTTKEGMKFKIKYYGKCIDAFVPAIGKHNVYNALAAFAIGILVNMNPEKIVHAMLNYKNTGLRQLTANVNGIIVIADCYNASPDSMKSAIDVVKNTVCTGKRICVFGDMLELGDISENAHTEVGKDVGRANVDMLYCYGKEAKYIKRGALQVGMKNVKHFEDKQELVNDIKATAQSGDCIIFKASRGVKLEEVINSLNEEWTK